VHVLLLTETYFPEVGGGEQQARLLSTALTSRGHQITIVTRCSRRDLPRDEFDGRVRVVRLSPAGPGRWRKWGLMVSTIGPLRRLGAQADVVLVSGYRILGVTAVAVTRMLGRPCVLKADSAGEMSGEFFRAGLARGGLTPQSTAVRWLMAARNRVLRQSAAFIAISREIADELQAAGVPRDRIRCLPNGVDTATFRPASDVERVALRRELGLPPGPLAIYTGRLVSYKGLPTLVRVWSDLRRSGCPCTLVLVGAGGADMHNCEDELRSYVAANGLEETVRFTGAVTGVERYLRAADLFVFPTENEAFGVSLIEAMACGLPSVATPVGGIRDFLVHGENGLLVDAGSGTRLREAIETLLADRSLAAALGRRARETVMNRFAAGVVADQYVQLFESIH
jgi:glycosyltransferase involved in cell wall biosynthesis